MSSFHTDYVTAAALSSDVEQEMLARLDVVAMKPQQMLVFGFATESIQAQMAAKYPGANVNCFDYLDKMEKQWQSVEVGKLAFEEESVDLIIANLFLPWCVDPTSVLKEWKRILRPEGLLVFTSLGPDTLLEIQNPEHILPKCIDMHNLGDLLMKTGFADPVLDVENYEMHYKDAQKLQHEMQVTGMVQAHDYEFLSNKLSFEVIYAHTWGKKQLPENEAGVFKFPLEHLRGRK